MISPAWRHPINHNFSKALQIRNNLNINRLGVVTYPSEINVYLTLSGEIWPRLRLTYGASLNFSLTTLLTGTREPPPLFFLFITPKFGTAICTFIVLFARSKNFYF